MEDSIMTNSSSSFIPQIENMDLSKLKDKTFTVAVSTGDRDKRDGLISTIRGPFNFHEMVEYVAELWANHMHHSKVYLMNPQFEKPIEWLDAKTIDYIIERSVDIIMEDVFLNENNETTCEAGVMT